MADEAQRTMWATTDRDARRYFLIPDGTALAAGPLVLRTLKGEKKEVDPAAVASFEVDEERAKAVVQEEMASLARKANSFLTSAAAAIRAATAPAPDAPGRKEAEFNFASVLGMTPDDVRAHPEQAVEALKATLNGMTSTLRDAMQTQDPIAKDVAKKRMEAVSSYLSAQGGGEFKGTLESLPDRLKAFLADPDLEKRIREASQQLKDAADELRADLPQEGVNRRE
jgi:hypothetical protein